MKMYYIPIITLLLITCSNSEVAKPFENPKEFAKVTLEIVDSGKDNKKLSSLFERMGYNLTNGSRKYIEAHDEIKKDQEKYKIFHDELAKLIKKKAFQK